MLQLKSASIKNEKTKMLVIPVCEDKELLEFEEDMVLSIIKKAKELEEFKGKEGDELVLYNLPDLKIDRVLLLGLGKLEKVNKETLRVFAGKAVKKCITMTLSQVDFAIPSSNKININMSGILESIMEGAYLGNHIFDKYKSKKKKKPLEMITFNVKKGHDQKFNDLVSYVKNVCHGTILARQWVSTPSNEKRPDQFANSIISQAKKENLAVTVLDVNDLKEKKFGALLSVSAGSSSKPSVVILEYNPKDYKGKPVALVGKGVTFDSGGINLKPSGALDEMKMDMAGAAAVAATMISVAKIKPKIKVVGIIPIVENMPSGNASRPGDIVESYAGKTIEILNTDAEGRLILADAMVYATREYQPKILIDVATLTGACVIALGEMVAGVFSTDDKLAEAIVKSGKKTHERCWHMPMPDDYKKFLKSDIADIRNISTSRWGGAITAALFLSEFIEDVNWAHMDIAGPAFTKKEGPYCQAGGTGFGVRLLCDYIQSLSPLNK